MIILIIQPHKKVRLQDGGNEHVLGLKSTSNWSVRANQISPIIKAAISLVVSQGQSYQIVVSEKNDNSKLTQLCSTAD